MAVTLTFDYYDKDYFKRLKSAGCPVGDQDGLLVIRSSESDPHDQGEGIERRNGVWL